MQTRTLTLATAFVLGLCMLVLTGCQMPGKTVATDSSVVCPNCKNETKTSPIKGLTYTKHICPQCGNETGPDVSGENPNLVEVTHTCDQCELIVEMCPQCEEKK